MSLIESVFDDMHCHVGFMSNPCQFAREAGKAQAHVLAASVTPQDYLRLSATLSEGLPEVSAAVLSEALDASPAVSPEVSSETPKVSPAVSPETSSEVLSCQYAKGPSGGHVSETGKQLAGVGKQHARVSGKRFTFVHPGLGIHPWWIPEDKENVNQLLNDFDGAFSGTKVIGEVGLDFSRYHLHTAENQKEALSFIFRRCADRGGFVLSLHCVQAYSEMFDLFKQTMVLSCCTGIFHWFSGSSQDLMQAIESGCYFSISKRMLSSKRGKEYVKAIPEDRLLLETDAPHVPIQDEAIPVTSCSFEQVQEELQETFRLLAELRNQDSCHLAAVIKKNAQRVLSLK